VLDGIGIARAGGVGIFAGVAEAAALAQQVPALVEVDLDLVELLALRVVEARVAEEAVLFFDEAIDL
jgi:hypothetical protein